MKINFVGDLCLSGIDPEKFTIDKKILNIFIEGDLNIANLESPLTSSSIVKPNTPVALKASPEKNKIIDLIDIFSLANNHILDYGIEGFSETTSFLNKSGQKYFGAGENLVSAFSPLKIEKEDKKIAFLGFTRWENAKKNRAGTTPDDLRKLSGVIKNLKHEEYFIVIMPHWNYEYVRYPAPDNRKLGKKLIDAGADIIIGSHPHIYQGYEQYKGKYVFHSMGNFIFHSEVFKSISMIRNDPRLNISFILSVRIEDDCNYQIKIIPIYTNDNSIRLLDRNEEAIFEENITKFSSILDNERKYKEYFYKDATGISDQSTKMLKKLASEQGLKNLFKTLIKVRKQDIKVKLSSFFLNNKNNKIRSFE